MAVRRGTVFVVFLLAALVGCSGSAATEVILVLDADDGVRADAAALQLEVRGGPTGAALADYEVRFDSVFEPGATPVRWPRQVGLVPRNPDMPGGFWLEASALAADGTTVLVARRHATYDVGRAAELRLVLEDACVGVVCDGDTSTCIAGGCASAEVTVADLPDYLE